MNTVNKIISVLIDTCNISIDSINTSLKNVLKIALNSLNDVKNFFTSNSTIYCLKEKVTVISNNIYYGPVGEFFGTNQLFDAVKKGNKTIVETVLTNKNNYTSFHVLKAIKIAVKENNVDLVEYLINSVGSFIKEGFGPYSKDDIKYGKIFEIFLDLSIKDVSMAELVCEKFCFYPKLMTKLFFNEVVKNNNDVVEFLIKKIPIYGENLDKAFEMAVAQNNVKMVENFLNTGFISKNSIIRAIFIADSKKFKDIANLLFKRNLGIFIKRNLK